MATHDKDASIREMIEKSIDSADESLAIAAQMGSGWQMASEYVRGRVDMVNYLKSLDDHPITPWAASSPEEND